MPFPELSATQRRRASIEATAHYVAWGLYMPIPEAAIQQAGGRIEDCAARQVLFAEGQMAVNYYQLAEGMVKMVNVGEEADFIQGVFFPGESFGEPPLMADFPYPATAVTMRRGRVWVLPKPQFIQLLRAEPDHHFALTRTISLRLLAKSSALREMKQATAGEHILALLHQLTPRLLRLQPQAKQDGVLHIPFTRQELADMLGLRVETVIRCLAELDRQNRVRIENRRLLLPLRPAR